MDIFQDEIEQQAIERIQKFSKIADKMGFEVCLGFLGGKDSQVDELADTVIRLLDTAGSNNINIDLYPVKSSIYKNKIPEYFYEVIKNMMYSYSWGQIINYTIKYILDLCKILDIDIAWHIKFKMNYNRLREYKHGKKF